MTSLPLSRSQDLRETNQRLRRWFDRRTAESGQRQASTSADISALLADLLNAGAKLRIEPIPAPGVDAELDRELQQYRHNVELLRQLLPSIHGQLLAERARLEWQRARVQSAAQWARCSRQTL